MQPSTPAPSPASDLDHDPLQDPHITITLRQAFSLMRALLSLKCLQSINSLLKASGRRMQNSGPANWTRQTIARKERLITDIFLYIIPQHVFRSAPRSNQPPSLLTTITTTTAPRVTIYAPPAIHIAQYLSESRDDIEEGGVELQTLPARPDTATARDSHLRSESIYSVSRGESVSMARLASRSSLPTHQHLVPLSAAQYTQTLPPRPWYSTTHPWSIDSVALPMSNESLAVVELEHVRKSMSAESFPGRFPISDGLECGSLDTSRNVLGRGATSVRPFSEI